MSYWEKKLALTALSSGTEPRTATLVETICGSSGGAS